jgi:hypothetical protein
MPWNHGRFFASKAEKRERERDREEDPQPQSSLLCRMRILGKKIIAVENVTSAAHQSFFSIHFMYHACYKQFA